MDTNNENPMFDEDVNDDDLQTIKNKYSIYFLEFMFYSILFVSFGYNLYKICNPKIDNCKRYLKIRSLKNYKLENDLLDECSICLNNLSKDQKVIQLKCNHIFHKSCILDWFNKNIENGCPLCRNNI